MIKRLNTVEEVAADRPRARRRARRRHHQRVDQRRRRHRRLVTSTVPGGVDVVGAGAGRGGVALPDHHAAAEVADLLAVLVEALGLDGDDAAVGLRRRLLDVEHPRLGVDRVAVERRELVLQRLDLEVGDRRPADVGHAHAEHERVHEVADDDVAPLHRRLAGEPGVGVQRVVVHRDHAEQVVVVLGDRLARPVPVHVADDEVLEVPAEGAFVRGHRRRRYRSDRPPGSSSCDASWVSRRRRRPPTAASVDGRDRAPARAPRVDPA